MKFNSKKFELIRYGPNEQIKMNTLYFTPNMENVIDEKDELRDLGVIMSKDMKFSKHVAKICSSVRQKTGWIHSVVGRNFHETNVENPPATPH